MNSELNEIRAHINRVLDAMPTEMAQQRTRAHLEWELKEMLKHIRSQDLKTSELLALIAILHPAHARVLTPITGDKAVLRIVPDVEKLTQPSKSAGQLPQQLFI